MEHICINLSTYGGYLINTMTMDKEHQSLSYKVDVRLKAI